MDDGEHSGADHSEQRHRLGEPVDRISPALLKEQQDGGDQGSGMADTDPPDEIDDRKAPGYRLGDSPNSSALKKEPRNRDHQNAGNRTRNNESAEPAQGRVRREHDAGDLLRNRFESMSRRNDPLFPSCRVDHRIIHGNVSGCHAQSNLLAVLGRVDRVRLG